MAAPMVPANTWTGMAAGLAVEELETELLLEAVFQRFGHDFRAYDRQALRERLARLLQTLGARTLSGLQERVLHDGAEASRLLRAFAPAPAGVFDNPGHASRLRTVLAPSLRGWPLPRVWIAECAGIGEAWTLAIVLAEEGVLGRLDIHATLANEELVAEQQDAWLSLADVEAAQQRYAESGGTGNLAAYFEIKGGMARLQPQLRRRITWSQYSLVTDASSNEFQAIVSCHALSDFGPVLRQRVLRLFHDSLARFGVLCLDRPLAVTDAHAGSYQAVAGERPWYKRVG
nr:CheR family methyltransferase [uncultured Massilia sp.]